MLKIRKKTLNLNKTIQIATCDKQNNHKHNKIK